jgi:phosphate transport system substrate-binding protein
MKSGIKIGIGSATVLAAGLLATGCGGSGNAGTTSSSTTGSASSSSGGNTSVLVGAGSSLVAPLVSSWQGPYEKANGVTITYGAIGSGGGIEQITARTVDFAGSDASLTSDQKSACNGCVMIPWALAATTVSYNVPNVSAQIKLSGPVIGDMFLGNITNWNDPAIAKLNPGVQLPDLAVHVVHRSDASGDTFAFTDYLSKVSSAWKSKEGGATTSVQWPTGVGGKGNSGVAGVIEQTPGAVGYVAIAQAKGSNLTYALIENKAGNFPDPGPKTIANAAAAATFKSDNSTSIVDPPASAPNAYPISTFTYAIVPKDSSKMAALKQFLDYAVTDGQQYATGLSFAPLPPSVASKDKSIIAGL